MDKKKKTTIFIVTIALSGLLMTTAVYAYESNLWQNPKVDSGMGHKLKDKNFKQFGPGLKIKHKKQEFGYIKESRAEILGLSEKEVKEKIKSGMTFKDIIEEAGYTEESFRNAMHERISEKMKSKLEQLVEQGKITEKEAAEKLERMEEMREWKQKSREKILAAQAELLDMSAEELKSELKSGKKLKELVEEAGFEVSEFHEKMAERRKAIDKVHLEELLTDGKITQKEYDKKLEWIEKGPREKFKDKFKPNVLNIKSDLEELVDEGVITSEQFEKIMDKLKLKAKDFFHSNHPRFQGSNALEIAEDE